MKIYANVDPWIISCLLQGLLHKHVARVALARELLIAVYALLHDGVVFEEEKFAAV